jgi:predicted RNA-binding Zn-ribbon protein involved in translation (DUF1610 family)
MRVNGLRLPCRHWTAPLRDVAPGLVMGHRDYGTIKKCPHCELTNIVRNAKNQKTCGRYLCQLAQIAARKVLRKADVIG